MRSRSCERSLSKAKAKDNNNSRRTTAALSLRVVLDVWARADERRSGISFSFYHSNIIPPNRNEMYTVVIRFECLFYVVLVKVPFILVKSSNLVYVYYSTKQRSNLP